MKVTARNLHRDLAYLYVGILISFAFSGIFLNHRDSWDPKQYSFSERDVTIPISTRIADEQSIEMLSSTIGVNDKLRRYALKDSLLKISFERHEVTIDLKTGRGRIEEYRTTPVLGHMARLHKSNSNWWIYYSDAFGVAVLTISVTGLFLVKGKYSFRSRGWKLALAGIVFPLIFIFFIM